jgi:1-acyl-sn-glycerol-3-phosphate acyltransferase
VLYAILKPIAGALAWALFRLRTRGRANVPRQGPVLLVANHLSVLDPPLVGVAAPRPLEFMAKEELFRVPVLGPLIRRLHAHPVRRDGSDSRALKAALALLAEGRALLVFPEGTRGEEGRLGPARPGAGMLALLSGAPVVPVHIAGTSRALPRGRAWPRPTRVRIAFGPALSFKPLDDSDGQARKEQYHEAAQEMMCGIQQLMNDGDGDDVRRSA